MKFTRISTRISILVLTMFFLFNFTSLAQEKVNLKALLPESAVKELFNAYPNLKVTQVGKKKDGNTSAVYRNTYLLIDGVENKEARERLAKYFIEYLENPNKRIEDRRRHEERRFQEELREMEMEMAELRLELAEARLHLAELRADRMRKEVRERRPEREIPSKEKLNQLIKRIKSRSPNFSYKWVGLEKGNVKAKYGDNSLIIKGIEGEKNREEIAGALIRIQKQIDKSGAGKKER